MSLEIVSRNLQISDPIYVKDNTKSKLRLPEIRKKTKFVYNKFFTIVNTYFYPNDKLNHSLEAAIIFFYTIIDRIRDIFYFIIGKSNYYNQNIINSNFKLSKDKILDFSDITRIQNIGHSTMFIQTKNLNILTDPVFNHLNFFFYRRKTLPAVKLEDLPIIDLIIISHNHHDHMELKTLRRLAKKNSNIIIIVPKGERQRVQNLGFKKENIKELNWWQKITITNNQKKVEIIAVPCRHWSNRGAFDNNESLFNGYVINPKKEKKAIYFAGDTAKLEDIDLQAIGTRFNIAYNIQPSGPNFPRKYMQGTHQSTLDAIRTHFVLRDINNRKDLKTIFMHHQTYRLGPDKFDETEKIMRFFYYNFWGRNKYDIEKFYYDWMVKEKSYLDMLKFQKDKEAKKSFETQIFNPKIGSVII